MADNNESTKIEWYVVHTYSGYENKVMSSLQKTVESNGLQDRIVDVRIPVEDVIKNGKRHTVQRKLLPGYVMVKMLMTDDTWYVVRNTRGVTGFVGAGNKPLPLSETDLASLFDPSANHVVRTDIHVGDNVHILSGLFENFTGRVTSVDEAAQRVHVVVPMLKRETDVELALDEVLPAEE